ncbi:TIGR00297 family protein [Methanosarcina sp. MSH10X1]|uniref:TIGR00297 family protein n=1 Tax=Methanosarcina sp. MSH10X1 TaxID=2507075 RepID=UPI000FFC2186|nr:TIGR00297 family protein [Methanosarcina sp. MSH10X1]RXA21907.1 TIGR00297 family protein [Methanosarcina sp. MSH10X1]
MNRAARSFKKGDSFQGIPVTQILYLLLILIAPFAGVNLLFILSIGLFVGIRFSGSAFSCGRDVTSLIFSLALMLFVSVISGGSSYTYPFYIVLAAFAVAAVGNHSTSFSETDPVPDFNTRRNRIKKRSFSILWSSTFLALRIAAAFLAASWIIYWQELSVSYNLVFFIAVIGAVTGSLFESIPSKIDKNISVPLGAGMTMWIFEEFRYWVPPEKMVVALAFSFFLGVLAYRAKIADVSALLSAALLGVLIIVFSGISWFLLLLTFFILGGGFTRYKYAYKESIGIAQAKDGIRSYENVFSNSMAALALAVAYGVFPEHSLPIVYAYMGTVATATGDTLASEIGTTAKGRPRMITTLKLSEPGADGAVSMLGEFAAILGSAVIGILAYLLGISDNLILTVLITTAGGFFGTNIDSLLGATLQKRGVLSNSGVNFAATFAGAGISAGLYYLIT